MILQHIVYINTSHIRYIISNIIHIIYNIVYVLVKHMLVTGIERLVFHAGH